MRMVNSEKNKSFTSTRNPCKLCAPLGAAIVFRGIKAAVPFLHGSQGCATYIRRYLISHFREPMDIAASGFSEETSVFGGKQILKSGLENVCRQYNPRLIGIATTCVVETIGEDLERALGELKEKKFIAEEVKLVSVSTPSFKGTHIDGFRSATKAIVGALAQKAEKNKQVNIFPGFLSCADLRQLKEIMREFSLPYVMVPDYSDTLDGGIWGAYHKIPEGGTSVEQIMSAGGSAASIEFSRTILDDDTSGQLLFERFGVPFFKIGIPLGIKETDIFFKTLEGIAGITLPRKYAGQRARLIDSYVDGHKYLFEKKAVIFADEDLAVALVSFLSEIGVIPVLCASGGKSENLSKAIAEVAPEFIGRITVIDDADFMEIKEAAEKLKPDFLIGNSKGFKISRELGLPLVRVGFPIHDRIGGQRMLNIGYSGTQQLFDRVVNTLLAKGQDDSAVGYSYL